MTKTIQCYETSDVDIAAFLISEGISSLVETRSTGNKRYFVLSPAPEGSIISDFINNNITVRPAGLLATRKRLITSMQSSRVVV